VLLATFLLLRFLPRPIIIAVPPPALATPRHYPWTSKPLTQSVIQSPPGVRRSGSPRTPDVDHTHLKKQM
jgi:hypothetical protein